MSDTIVQECTKCFEETDCVEGLCQECALDLAEEAALATEENEAINIADDIKEDKILFEGEN